MRKTWWVIPVLLLSLLALVGCDTGGTGISDETASAAPLAQEMDDVVSATCEVRPARWAGLAFPVGGTIEALHVEEGEAVPAGQLLAELDAISLGRAVAEAEAALAAAEANLARTKAGPRPEDVAAGTFTLEGELPVNTDGGLKCFGHPLSASGLRMIYEVYKQLQGKAERRQVKDAATGLTHNVGGINGFFNCTVAIFGRPD